MPRVIHFHIRAALRLGYIRSPVLQSIEYVFALITHMRTFIDGNGERKAVGVGFEPTVRETRTPVFKTGPFDHSGTPPWDAVRVAGGYCNESRPIVLPRLCPPDQARPRTDQQEDERPDDRDHAPAEHRIGEQIGADAP